ncbi:MAG: hypothetical protein QXM46_01370 [Candidatus Hadarchaeales archaeon]
MRGFFSLDAIFALTLLMMVCSSFLHVYQARMEGARGIGEGLEARMVGEELAGAINSVYSNGSGLELRLSLPERLASLTLSFDPSAGEVVVERGGRSVRVGTVCNNVEAFLLTSENLGKPLRIYWEENRIRVVGG